MSLSLTIPENVWIGNIGIADPLNHLWAHLDINGRAFHLEAWEVTTDAETGVQTTASPDYADEFALLHNAVHGEGPFQTMTINGRDYVVLTTPHC